MSGVATPLPAGDVGVEVFARPGSRISDEQAALIYQVAQQLPERERTAKNLLEISKDPASPIHGFFEWDDEKAAVKYREDQARLLMRSISIRITYEDQVVERPAFYSVRLEVDHEYVTSYVRYGVAREDAEIQERVLGNALRDVKAFVSRYEKYREILADASPEFATLLELADRILEQEG